MADACNAVVTALQTYASDSDVSEFACRAIYNLCYDEKNVKDLGKKGACAWVVAVLQKHADKSTVVTQACLAIHGLAVRVKNERIHPGNTRKLVEKGAIETVVAVMQKFPQNAEVQQAAALAIASLGRLEPNRILLGSGGACELIITGMNNHSSNGEVIGKLALAVEVLATKSETHTAKVLYLKIQSWAYGLIYGIVFFLSSRMEALWKYCYNHCPKMKRIQVRSVLFYDISYSCCNPHSSISYLSCM